MTSVMERPTTQAPTVIVTAKPQPDTRYMRIIGREPISWDRLDEATHAQAFAYFAKAVAGGRVAFATNPTAPAEAGERITTFDPNAKEILFVAPLVGG